MMTGTATNSGIDNGDTKVIDNFYLLEPTITRKGTSSQEICRRPALCKVAVKTLEKIIMMP